MTDPISDRRLLLRNIVHTVRGASSASAQLAELLVLKKANMLDSEGLNWLKLVVDENNRVLSILERLSKANQLTEQVTPSEEHETTLKNVFDSLILNPHAKFHLYQSDISLPSDLSNQRAIPRQHEAHWRLLVEEILNNFVTHNINTNTHDTSNSSHLKFEVENSKSDFVMRVVELGCNQSVFKLVSALGVEVRSDVEPLSQSTGGFGAMLIKLVCESLGLNISAAVKKDELKYSLELAFAFAYK